MWMALIAALLGGGSQILGSILQNNRAKDILQEGEKYKQYGMQGMESLLAERQQAYNNVWKMIYGGVSNFDFNSPSQTIAKERTTQGATDVGAGGTAPTEKKPQGALEKDREWWTQERLPHESEF